MKLRHVIAIIVFIIAIYTAYNWPEPQPDAKFNNELKAIDQKLKFHQDTINTLLHFIDSLKAKQYDTVYIPLYRKSRSVQYLDADSTIKLFQRLNEGMQIPDYIRRHSLFNPDTIHTELQPSDSAQ